MCPDLKENSNFYAQLQRQKGNMSTSNWEVMHSKIWLNRLNWTCSFNVISFKTPCTYPRRSYLESLHGDAHRVPYLCSSRGHGEFRALRSSWKDKKKKRQKKKVIVLSMESKSCWTPVLSQREGDKYNFLSIKVMGREARDLRFFHPKDCAGFILPWWEKDLNWVDAHY